MNKYVEWIFSLRNRGPKKVLTVLGSEIKFENKKYFIKRNNKDKDGVLRNQIFNEIQEENYRKNICTKFSFEDYLNDKIITPEYLTVDSQHHHLNVLLKTPEWKGEDSKIESNEYNDFVFCWEIRPRENNCIIAQMARKKGKKIIFVGDSFLRSINTMADKNAEERYKKGISFTFDDLTCYFDATRPSRLEVLLNDKNFRINEEQLRRARKCIDFIVSNRLTKYNYQPIYTPNIGRKGVKKVLVVDQSYGDMSILKGFGDDSTFEKMLQAAIEENPDADIIVKTHPDTIAGQGGYYTKLKQEGNIYLQTTPINPISLIEYCDKVYVCTTQFGFEALMCGKEVHTFGMPFYAGWGLTIDSQKCERRTNKRTLEEVFYIAYIVYSYYVNPDKNCRCEIEEAMEYLLKLRGEYFSSKRGIVSV